MIECLDMSTFTYVLSVLVMLVSGTMFIFYAYQYNQEIKKFNERVGVLQKEYKRMTIENRLAYEEATKDMFKVKELYLEMIDMKEKGVIPPP